MADELTEREYDLITFIEQEYLLHGCIPSAARINELGLATEKWYQDFLSKTVVRENLLSRGVSFGDNKRGDTYVLTEEQLTVANIMLDLTDNRSRKKKLSDLGIPTQKWEAWLADPGFASYLRNRAERVLPANMHDAHLALLDRVRAGDTAAIKFYYEITGRYNPTKENAVDLPSLLMKVMEIIQRNVTDDIALRTIANEMLALAEGVAVGATRTIPGEVVPQLEGGVVNL